MAALSTQVTWKREIFKKSNTQVTWKRDGRRVTGTSSGVVTSSDGEVQKYNQFYVFNSNVLKLTSDQCSKQVHTLYLLSGGREAWGRYTCEVEAYTFRCNDCFRCN